MQHLDEGTIHSWLDGALSSEEAARAEAHVAECPQCAAAVAEARGFIAASSRILTALDHVPRGVVPAAFYSVPTSATPVLLLSGGLDPATPPRHGERVARAIGHFEFPVNGWSRSPKAVDGVQCFSGGDGFKDFLAASRMLVCLLPLTPETRDVMNRDTLSRLQPVAYVINVARGAHLVDEDLLALLDSGHLAGATLDVFRTEPLPPEHPFWTHPKVSVTPHTSARTLRSESIAQIAGKLEALQRGEPVAGIVDAARGY